MYSVTPNFVEAFQTCRNNLEMQYWKLTTYMYNTTQWCFMYFIQLYVHIHVHVVLTQRRFDRVKKLYTLISESYCIFELYITNEMARPLSSDNARRIRFFQNRRHRISTTWIALRTQRHMPGKVKDHEVLLKWLVTALLLEDAVAQIAFNLAKNTQRLFLTFKTQGAVV